MKTLVYAILGIFIWVLCGIGWIEIIKTSIPTAITILVVLFGLVLIEGTSHD